MNISNVVTSALTLITLLWSSGVAAEAIGVYSYTPAPLAQVGVASDVMFDHITCSAQKAYFQTPHFIVRTSRGDLFLGSNTLIKKCLAAALKMIVDQKQQSKLTPVFSGRGVQMMPPEVGAYDIIQYARWPGKPDSFEFILPWMYKEEINKMLDHNDLAACLSQLKQNPAAQQPDDSPSPAVIQKV